MDDKNVNQKDNLTDLASPVSINQAHNNQHQQPQNNNNDNNQPQNLGNDRQNTINK